MFIQKAAPTVKPVTMTASQKITAIKTLILSINPSKPTAVRVLHIGRTIGTTITLSGKVMTRKLTNTGRKPAAGLQITIR